MRSALTALLVVLLPMIGLATVQLSLPVLGPMLTAAAGVPPEAIGLLTGLCGLGSVWFYSANHAITPVLGPIRTLVWATLLITAGAALLLTAVWPLMLAGAVVIGFAYSATTPAGSQILVQTTPREHWGKLFSFRQAGVPVGGVIAGSFGTVLGVTYGWRFAVLAIAAVCLLLGLALLLAPARFQGGGKGRFRLAPLADPANLLRPWRSVRTVPGLARVTLANLGFALVQSSIQSFFVTYLATAQRLDLKLAGTLFAVLQATSVAGRILFGWAADRIGSPRTMLVILSGLSAAATVVLTFLSGDWPLPALIAVAAFIGISVATWNGLYLAEVARITPADRVSEATAGSTFFVFVTYGVTPVLFMLLVGELGYAWSYRIVAAAALAAGVLLATAPSPSPLVGEGRSGG